MRARACVFRLPLCAPGLLPSRERSLRSLFRPTLRSKRLQGLHCAKDGFLLPRLLPRSECESAPDAWLSPATRASQAAPPVPDTVARDDTDQRKAPADSLRCE